MKPPMCIDDGYATAWEAITASRRFQHRVEVFFDQILEHLGMTFAQYRALEAIAAHRDLHVSELARRLRVWRQAALAAVAKLDDGGLVDLEGEAGRVYGSTSDLGARRLAQCRRFTHDLKQQLEEALSPAERFKIVLLLERGGRALASPTRPEWWLAP
jgi:DNA-binding MarR family transcriptional regulator